jgi:hypothetical protein
MTKDTVFTAAHILMSGRPGLEFEHALRMAIDHVKTFDQMVQTTGNGEVVGIAKPQAVAS